MLETMSAKDLKMWEAYFYVESGAYHKAVKDKKTKEFYKLMGKTRG